MTISPFIEENDVSLVTLSLELEKATIEHETRPNSLYIQEPGMFPFWVNLHEEPKYILINTYLNFVPTASNEMRLSLCNRINEKLFLPSTYIHTFEHDGEDEQRFMTAYPIYYRDGLIASHFIRMCRTFSNALKQIQDEFDRENEILEPLGRRSRV